MIAVQVATPAVHDCELKEEQARRFRVESLALACCEAKEVTMRLIVFSLLMTLGLISPGAAEERVNVLPEIVVGGSKTTPTAIDRCVDVQIGSSRSMDCINQKLKGQVDSVNPSINLPPIDAKSSDTKVGVVNIPGVQQQYGKNFGVSVVPFRPAPPVFSSPRGH